MPTTAQWMPKAGGELIARLWVPQQMGVILMQPTYVPNLDGHMRYADVQAQELPSAGLYTQGGKEILNRSILYDAGNDEYVMYGDDVVWGPGALFETSYGFVYEMATTDKFLWEILFFNADITVSGVFTVDFLSGILSTKAAAPV